MSFVLGRVSSRTTSELGLTSAERPDNVHRHARLSLHVLGVVDLLGCLSVIDALRDRAGWELVEL